jgi:hypothetical protein
VSRPWLLSKYLASFVLDGTIGASNPAEWLYDKVRTSRIGHGSTGLRLEASANDLWHGALVQVQVELHGRGTLGDVAAIYPLRDDEIRNCGSSFDSLQEVRSIYQSSKAVSEMSAVPGTSTLSPRFNHWLPYVRSLLAFTGAAPWHRHCRLVQDGRSEEANVGVRSPILRSHIP